MLPGLLGLLGLLGLHGLLGQLSLLGLLGTWLVEHAWLVCFAWLALACVISNPGQARIPMEKSSFRIFSRPNSQSNHTPAV